jgi:hypothetical protein
VPRCVPMSELQCALPVIVSPEIHDHRLACAGPCRQGPAARRHGSRPPGPSKAAALRRATGAAAAAAAAQLPGEGSGPGSPAAAAVKVAGALSESPMPPGPAAVPGGCCGARTAKRLAWAGAGPSYESVPATAFAGSPGRRYSLALTATSLSPMLSMLRLQVAANVTNL